MFEGIYEIIHREMDNLDEKYASGNVTLTPQDLEHIDLMAHALKSLATYEAMKTGGDCGGSYAKLRSRQRYYRDEDRRY